MRQIPGEGSAGPKHIPVVAMTHTMACPAARPGEDLHMLADTLSALQQDQIDGIFAFPSKVKACSSMYIHHAKNVPPFFLLCSALYWQPLDTGTAQCCSCIQEPFTSSPILFTKKEQSSKLI